MAQGALLFIFDDGVGESDGAKRRACCEAMGEGEPPKGGEATGQGIGESRRRWERSDRATAAEGRGPVVRTGKRQGSSPNGEDREAGFVEPGVAKPRPAE